jgi:hypothetical protein
MPNGGQRGTRSVKAKEGGMHQEEEQVRHALIAWAQRYFAPELDDPMPEVTVLCLCYNQAEDE